MIIVNRINSVFRGIRGKNRLFLRKVRLYFFPIQISDFKLSLMLYGWKKTIADMILGKPLQCNLFVRFEFIYKQRNEISKLFDLNYTVQKKAILDNGQKVCSHKFNFFGTKMIKTRSSIQWNKDYVSGKCFKKTYWKNLSGCRKDQPDDPIYLLKLNQHQHFFDLGKAYFLSKDECYAKEFYYQINDWIKRNPVEIGIAWNGSFVVSLRVLSWIGALHFFKGSRYLTTNFEKTITKQFILHGKFIEKNLSFRKIPNNHLIVEATALFALGSYLGNISGFIRWQKIYLEILESQIKNQVFEDGWAKENSIAYHRLIVDCFTYVIILMKISNMNIPKAFLNSLEKMYSHMMCIVRSDNFGPNIGDGDDRGCRLTKLCEQPGRFLASALSTGAVLFARGDMKWVAKDFHEESLWLLGMEGLENFESLDAYVPKYTSYGFKESGQYIMRSGLGKDDLYMYFDCGPQGMGLAGHGHADALSFEICAYGQPLLIDSGTYTYNGSKEWRNYFRGTSAHNTILIDGVDQAEPLNPYDAFGWEKKADAHNITWHSSNYYDFVGGYHDGYKRLEKPVRHRREIFFKKPVYWIIVDYITGEGKHSFDLFFHLSNMNFEIDKEKKELRSCGNKDSNILIISSEKKDTQMEVIKGCLNPIQGWISYNYGDKEEAPVLKYSKNSGTPVTFSTILFPFKGSVAPNVKVDKIAVLNASSEPYCNASCILIEQKDFKDYFLVSYETGKIKYFGNFSTDAEVVYARQCDKTISEIFFQNGKFFNEGKDNFIRFKQLVSKCEIKLDNSGLNLVLFETVSLEIGGFDIHAVTVNGLKHPFVKSSNNFFLEINYLGEK